MIFMTNALGRKWWTLQRFGYSPTKMLYRFTNRYHSKIICISLPKAGTHLVERLLCLYPPLYRTFLPTITPSNLESFGGIDSILTKQKPGEIVISHLYYDPEDAKVIINQNVKSFFIIRDPRDIVVSFMFYIMREKNHHHHEIVSKSGTISQKLQLLIEGTPSENLSSINQLLACFSGWFAEENFVIRFEELVTPNDGNQRQLEILHEIYDYLQIDVDAEWLQQLRQDMISEKSPTYRKGTTQQWKKYFDADTKQLFKDIAGDSLIQYGYEQNHDW